LNFGLSGAADVRDVPRFSSDIQRPAYLVSAIVALANQTTTLAVDSAVEAAHAEAAQDPRTVAEQVCRLAVGAAVATGEIASLAQELDLTTASDGEIAAAGIAVTGLQASLLSIAAAVQEVAEHGGPGEAFSAAEALRTAALALDELLPSYQPNR
jgi:methyl-accepting chemotaxis protein